MSTKEQIAAAYEFAESVLALEGMVKPAGVDRFRQAIIDGEMTSEDAIAAFRAQYTQPGNSAPDQTA